MSSLPKPTEDPLILAVCNTNEAKFLGVMQRAYIVGMNVVTQSPTGAEQDNALDLFDMAVGSAYTERKTNLLMAMRCTKEYAALAMAHCHEETRLSALEHIIMVNVMLKASIMT